MSRKRSVSLLKRDQVFGSSDFKVSYSDGWCKGGNKSRLACPDQGDRTSIVPRLSKLLQEIYYGLFRDSHLAHGPFEEREEMGMGCRVPSCLQKLKDAITLKPVLRLPNLEFPFEVHTNASDRALGGVLVQEGHPVAFKSRRLNATEQRYNAHGKEMTEVILFLETWKHYLMGMWFVVVTDNVVNTLFKTQKKLTSKQARWQEFLADFNFVWVYKLGRHNQVADALSRKEVVGYVGSLSIVVAYLKERVRHEAA